MNESKYHAVPMQPTIKYTKDGVSGGPKSQQVDVLYKQLMGCLNFISILGRFCEAPTLPQWTGLKQILAYLYHSINLSLVYRPTGELIAYTDADYASCQGGAGGDLPVI